MGRTTAAIILASALALPTTTPAEAWSLFTKWINASPKVKKVLDGGRDKDCYEYVFTFG